MKKVWTFIGKQWAFLLSMGFIVFLAYAWQEADAATAARKMKKEQAERIVGEKHDYIFDQMGFNAMNVVETFSYNGTAFYMVYDDIDAGCDYEVIRLSKETFDAVEKAIKSRNFPCTGILKATKPFESVEYIITFDEWRILAQK